MNTDVKREIISLTKSLYHSMAKVVTADEFRMLIERFKTCLRADIDDNDAHNISTALLTLKTAQLFVDKVDTDKNMLAAILFYPYVIRKVITIDDIRREWGDDVAGMIAGLEKVGRYSSRNSAVDQDNFRGLLLSLADDIRVIIIMIVHSLALMRQINHHPDEEWVRRVAFEANCIYAQLAHRLGLYVIKGELEDLSLKYTNREIFTQIAHKLKETKEDRENYISSFIAPVKAKLQAAGLTFEIKGRTKSISSIWNKMQKQKVDIQHIYDLFAIRVIIDTPLEKEKSDCWLAYSILADMYTANPARMKDWISIPKSNGYESLHATVMGPQNKWVEVQFRTRRMDLVAEKGLAAHWRYKGGKSDSTDQWMNNVRDILETAEAGPMQLMKNMKMNIYNKEVFAFTPKGDLFRLANGATVLDFAFHIHSRVGCQCTGAIVNGRHERIAYKIKSGDTIEIITLSTQTPKQDWLAIAVTSKARNKIKQSLNEAKTKIADLGKEMLERRAKNRKMELEESILMRAIKKCGFKYSNDFYAEIADEKLDINKVLSVYQEIERKDAETTHVAADEFKIVSHQAEQEGNDSDVLVIGEKSIKGLNYRFAKCCNPIYGDEVFGFISSDGVVKIHKNDCPNAPNIKSRYPYRLINVQWSGTSSTQMTVSLRIVGHDDIGIVTNITSIISKEKNVTLRNISIDSHDGLFQGYLVIGIPDTDQLNALIRKIRTVKGVKDVTRS